MSCNVNCFLFFEGDFCLVGERDFLVGDWDVFFDVVGLIFIFFFGLLDLSSSSDKIMWISSE
jgi:hypothetical protein